MNAQEIKELIEQQKAALFSGSLATIKKAQTGEPVPMLDEADELRHWFIPFIDNGKVVGFAIVNLEGKVAMNGSLTPNAKGKVDPVFFSQPPPSMLTEIKKAYPNLKVVSHSFSYDEIPQRWAWRVKLESQQKRTTIFVGPTGWYEKKDRQPGREG